MANPGPSKLFIDTGGFIAILHKSDPNHQKMVKYYNKAKESVTFYTTNFVASETYTWLRYHAGHHIAVQFLDTIETAVDGNELTAVQVDSLTETKARQLLRKYSDQEFSYVDATSFVAMDLLDVNDVLGCDSHYLILGKVIHPQ
jgi:predicted nucleic acid-binding protein